MYPDIKAYCETTGTGIMTQCMRSDKATQEDYKMKQYCRMLGLKINVKVHQQHCLLVIVAVEETCLKCADESFDVSVNLAWWMQFCAEKWSQILD